MRFSVVRGIAAVAALVGALAPVSAQAAQTAAPRAAFTLTGSIPGSSTVTLGVGKAALRLPVVALPYLGNGLDPRLFQAGSLAALERDGRLPVWLSYPSRPPRVPGVTITTAGHGTARGYLTEQSSLAFDAALARQFAADHARGSYGRDGMFAGGVTVSLSRAVPRPVRTGFRMHTLTVHGTDLTGHADTGDVVMVFNADNSNVYGSGPMFWIAYGYQSWFYHGGAKFSVPTGHYWAIGDFIKVTAQGVVLAERLDVLPQFTVSSDTTITLAERAASSKVLLHTPRPAVVASTALELRRIPAVGPAMYGFWQEAGTTPLWVSPTRTPPSTGQLQVDTDQWLTSPAHTAKPYAYALAYASNGVIPPQDRAINPAQLATVHASYYSDLPSHGVFTPVPFFSPQLSEILWNPGSPEFFLASMPYRATVYLTGNPAITWDAYTAPSATFDPNFGFWRTSGGQCGTTTYRTGQVLTESWNAYPLHTGVSAPGDCGFGVPRLGQLVPSASREGNTLRLDVTPFSDAWGHSGDGYLIDDGTNVTGSYAIDSNGRRVAAGSGVLGPGRAVRGWMIFHFWQVQLGSKPSTIRFAVTAQRDKTHYPLSTAIRTVWTWHSAAQTGLVPSGWTCEAGGTRVTDPHCAVQPMMTLGYRVAGQDLTGTVPAGIQHLDLSAGHLDLATASRITGLRAQVSFDGGQNWQPMHVTGQGNTYQATFDAAAGTYPTLRVSATDAAGGSVTETITNAYRIARASQAHELPGPACAAVPPGHARCMVIIKARTGHALSTGLGARDIQSAYRLPVARGGGQTVAIVDAYDTPHLETYLNTYRAKYNLGPCTVSNGCLRKVNQEGQSTPLPGSAVGTGWDVETTLDADMVSAACPRCKILVVEASSNLLTDLAAATNTAARLGAQVISNSYGGVEDGFALADAMAYHHRGHTIVAAAGDGGFSQANFPADLSGVTSVGGTDLSHAPTPRGWTESAWHYGSSGCSAYIQKPPWQHDRVCGMRTIADVSAVADNVAIYEADAGGWITVAGTSAAAPIIAGIYALADNATTIPPGYEYAHARYLFDVTTGNNALTSEAECGYTYLCVAKKGYDGPTGLGTPDGTGAF